MRKIDLNLALGVRVRNKCVRSGEWERRREPVWVGELIVFLSYLQTLFPTHTRSFSLTSTLGFNEKNGETKCER